MLPLNKNHNQSLRSKKMVKKHANTLDVSKNATAKCHDDHIILRFYGMAERLACWEIGDS